MRERQPEESVKVDRHEIVVSKPSADFSVTYRREGRTLVADDVMRKADLEAPKPGSDICAAAGFNPWGLIWLFKEFQDADPNQLPSLLLDHPANGERITTLENHFQSGSIVGHSARSAERRTRAVLAFGWQLIGLIGETPI